MDSSTSAGDEGGAGRVDRACCTIGHRAGDAVVGHLLVARVAGAASSLASSRASGTIGLAGAAGVARLVVSILALTADARRC